MVDDDPMSFPATVGDRERLITYSVGYGVGVGVALLLGVIFAWALRQAWLLLLPLVLGVAFGAPYFFHSKGYTVTRRELTVQRPIGAKRFGLNRVLSDPHGLGSFSRSGPELCSVITRAPEGTLASLH